MPVYISVTLTKKQNSLIEFSYYINRNGELENEKKQRFTETHISSILKEGESGIVGLESGCATYPQSVSAQMENNEVLLCSAMPAVMEGENMPNLKLSF